MGSFSDLVCIIFLFFGMAWWTGEKNEIKYIVTRKENANAFILWVAIFDRFLVHNWVDFGESLSSCIWCLHHQHGDLVFLTFIAQLMWSVNSYVMILFVCTHLSWIIRNILAIYIQNALLFLFLVFVFCVFSLVSFSHV